jgi:hypothetical protein
VVFFHLDYFVAKTFFFFCVQILLACFLLSVYVFQLILVFSCSHFSLAFCGGGMIFLHSSSHHSLLGVLHCVCITSLAASTVAFFMCSHSSFISHLGTRFINLLFNSDLHSLNFDGFCRFILFHFSTGFNYFLYTVWLTVF